MPSEAENILEIQRNLVAKEKAKQIIQNEKLRKDVRPQIARANGYNPEDQYKDWEHKPYPTWVKLPNGDSVIANNKTEHDALLGTKHVKAESVSVNIETLGNQHPEQVKVRRGRPPKAKPVDLPKDLD